MSVAAGLRAMTQQEYEAWYPKQVDDLVETGMDSATAYEQSRQIHQRALPDGLSTPHVHVLHVLDLAGAPVGVLWLGPHLWEPDSGYVWNIEISEHARGRGFGRSAMLAAEQIARDEGWAKLSLNVFGSNAPARHLYRSLGYAESSVTMDKGIT